jgi:hypothetical protein
MRTVMSDLPKAKELGKRAREWMYTHFSQQIVAKMAEDKIISAIERALQVNQHDEKDQNSNSNGANVDQPCFRNPIPILDHQPPKFPHPRSGQFPEQFSDSEL